MKALPVLISLLVVIASGPVVAVNTTDTRMLSSPSNNSEMIAQEGDTELVRVIIEFTSFTAREQAEFPHSAGKIVGGHGIDFEPILFADVSPELIPSLRNRSTISSVTRDRTVSLPPNQSTSPVQVNTVGFGASGQNVPWGVSRIGAREISQQIPSSAQDEVTVAVLDSGIDYTHPDLDSNVVWGADFTADTPEYGLASAMDDNGHGTAVAGIIAAEDNQRGVVGVAPNVNLYSMKVLNDDGEGAMSNVIKAIDSSLKGEDGTVGTSDDADVISISLGSDSGRYFLKTLLEEASTDAVIVSAAGNDGDGSVASNEITYPAKYNGSVAVGAVNNQNETPVFSAEGEQIELAAPGVAVETTNLQEGTRFFSGTSAAAPYVSGVAALVIAADLADGDRQYDASMVRSRLRSGATDIESDGVDKRSGYGLVRAEGATTGLLEFSSVIVNDLNPRTIDANQGADLDLSASLENIGDSVSVQDAVLRVDGEIITSKKVVIPGDKRQTVHFSGISTDNLLSGPHTYSVQTSSDTAVGEINVQGPPVFRISGISPQSPTAEQGSTIQITATFFNTGKTAGEREVALNINGETKTKIVTITGRSSEEVSFTIDTGQYSAGTQPFNVTSTSDTKTGTLKVTEPPSDVSVPARTVSKSVVSPGETVTVQLNKTLNTDTITVYEEFTPAVAGSEIESVTINDTQVTPTVSIADTQGIVVTLDDLSPGQHLNIQYTIEMAETTTDEMVYEIDGETTDGAVVSPPPTEIKVIPDTSLSPTADAYDLNNDGEINITELGSAASDFANNDLSISELGQVASAFAGT